MELTKAQKDIIINLLGYQLEQQKDIVRISQILQEFDSAFGSEIPDWKEREIELLRKTISGYVSVHVLESWS